jgi:hypothetical protein
MIFFLILQHSYKSFSTNFFDQHDIKMAIHKYVWKNGLIFGLLTWFLAHLAMIVTVSNLLPWCKKSSKNENLDPLTLPIT